MGGGSSFATKSWLISNGNFDDIKLTGYSNKDFVIDDNIIEGSYYLVKSLTDNTKLDANYVFEIDKYTGDKVPIFFNRSFQDIKKCVFESLGVTIESQRQDNGDGTFDYVNIGGNLKIYPNQREHKLYATNIMPSMSSKLNITMPDDSVITFLIKTISTAPSTIDPPAYDSDTNVVRCIFKSDRYGYYNGYGLTRTYLGSNFDDDIQACVMENPNNQSVVWNHHFGYASNQHNYKYVSVWLDDEILFNKATLNGNNVHWSNVPFQNDSQRTKWLSKCDGNYHKMHIKYWQ